MFNQSETGISTSITKVSEFLHIIIQQLQIYNQ